MSVSLSSANVDGNRGVNKRTVPLLRAGATFRVSGDLLYADGVADGTPASLYNLQGVLVSQTTVEGGAISLASLQKGVYAVQLGSLGSTLIRK